MSTQTFLPPGPGSWELESTHLVRPLSRWMSAVYPSAFSRGFAESMSRYGMLLDRLEPAVVNGFLYMAARPVGAPKDAKGPPPKLIFKLLLAFHPEIRRRIQRNREAWETKLWRQDVAKWDQHWKPAAQQTHETLGAIDVRRLDNRALADHLEKCRAATDHAIYLHHALNACYGLPIGDYLAHAMEWTGKPAGELLALLNGTSRVSLGAMNEWAVLGAALREDEGAAAVLMVDAPAEQIVGQLREWPGDVGAAARAYLAVVGPSLVTGYDVADLCGDEVPDALVGMMREALSTNAHGGDDADEARIAGVRDLVPAAHRDAFNAMLAEARFVNRVRDERTVLNDMRTVGLTRRAVLAAGERLVASGKLHEATHAVDLKPDELVALLSGATGPTAEETANHVRMRTTATIADAPMFLGNPPSPPPPADWMPGLAGRSAKAIGTLITQMFEIRHKQATGIVGAKDLEGIAASAGVYEGPARLMLSPADFGRVQKGDVLIARSTSPTYNVLLPLLGAIVTDRGGSLCHAALVAREFGIPAVVGTCDATRMIAEGTRVRVDGTTGSVTLLS